jgi:hypothetical protein
VVFESDDWGSIRMPTKDIYHKLLSLGLGLNDDDGERYSKYDSLESTRDMESLFQILDLHKDCEGAPAVFTAVAVVANPDFDKIKENGFQKYFYEPFPVTSQRYKGLGNTLKLYLEGFESNIFIPQFHGREHLNVPVWLKALQSNNIETHLAFNERMWSFVPKESIWKDLEYEAAFQPAEIEELKVHEEIIITGLNLFEKLFHYRAEYFVPPNGHINNMLNSVCFENGIKFRSTAKIQNEPIGRGNIRRKIHWLGQKDKNGITYLTRNCFFEPSSRGKDWVDSCLKDVKISFQWNKPAIISTHRVNYVGVHDVSNRDYGLRELNKLLFAILKNWPDVEFISSNQLGNIINGQFNK